MRDIDKRAPLLYAKALSSNEQPGTFEAVWSCFGNVDSDGDIVEPGAFAKSWSEKLPKVVFSHDWMSVPIGVTLEVDEYDRGKLQDLLPNGVPDGVTGAAWAKARLLVDVEGGEDHPDARKVYTALKAVGGDGRPALDEFSWGGRVLSETVEKRENMNPLYHLTEVSQTEWGPCMKGANPATALIAVKSAMDIGELSDADARKVLGLEPPTADDVKNVLNTDQLDALRALLCLDPGTSTADTLAALTATAGSAPPAGHTVAWTADQLMALAGF